MKTSKKPAAADQRLSIEYMELGVLKKFPKNPKAHNLGALGEAFENQGFVSWRATGE